MYELTLSAHSVLRWLVVLTALVALARAFGGWWGGRAWGAADAAANRWFVIATTAQFAIGLLLWGFLSPFGVAGFADMAATMKDATRRFWAVEHFTLMLVALALVHIGAARARKAAADAAKHRTAAIFFVIALALMLAGIPWVGADARPWMRLPM
jgi:hypothetical protein